MGKMQMVELDPVKMDHFMMVADVRALELSLGKSPNYLTKTRQRGRMPAGVYRLLCKLTELPEDALTPDPEPEHVADEPLPGQMELEIAPEPVRAYRVESDGNSTETYYDLFFGESIVLSMCVPRSEGRNDADCLQEAMTHLARAITEAVT